MGGFRPVGDTLRADYARMETKLRGELRKEMNAELSCLAGRGGAKMRWTVKSYYLYVFLRYRIQLRGWPREIPFMNLSDITGWRRISLLSKRWKTGKMYFAPVSDAALEAAMKSPISVAPGPLNNGYAMDLGRSDIKKRRALPKDGRPPRYVRNGPKSARLVTAAAEARAEKAMAEERAAMEVEEEEEISDDDSAYVMRPLPVLGPVKRLRFV
ncbi:hypothetical protein C8T65DRAFT_579055 [Cerioporus squamosus]|nr:hypothetical protein C8T65DRAFT_579055 [Cerioporus squamosus]